jgi:hypothetical protein
LKNVHKNLPQQAQKSPKCCSESKKPGTFQHFCPTFQELFLKSGFFDSFNACVSGGWVITKLRKKAQKRAESSRPVHVAKIPRCRAVLGVLFGSILLCRHD